MKFLTLFIFIQISLGVIAKGQDNNAKSLNLVIKVNKNRLCFKESIDLTTKITNLSKTPMIIDTKQIGYMTDFSWSISKSKGHEGGSLNFIGENNFASHKPKFVILQPNESYIENAPIPLENPAFTKARNYKMKIGIISIHDCFNIG